MKPRFEPENFNFDKADAELALFVDLFDTRWCIPGTNWRFGLDALAGLVPGIGDVVSGLAGLYVLETARRAGAGKALLGRMIGNLVLDTVVGSVPLLGRVFDIAFKANKMNLRLLEEHMARQRQTLQAASAKAFGPEDLR